MPLPDKQLFTIKETCAQLGLGRTSVYHLVKDGVLEVRYPMPDAPRITRDSIEAHIARAGNREAVRAAREAGRARLAAQQQHAQVIQAQQQEQKKEGLLSRWGLGGLTGRR